MRGTPMVPLVFGGALGFVAVVVAAACLVLR